MVKIVVAVGVGVVVCILFAGIYTLWVGGDVSRTWSNKLMRIRVLAQFVVIIIIMTALWLTSHH
jgi:hypothetical protein